MQVLSDDWKSSTVSAVFHSCVDKKKDSDGNWQPELDKELTQDQRQALDNFRENEADQEREEAFNKMYNEASDLQKATIMHVRKEDLKEKFQRLDVTTHAPVYKAPASTADVNAATNDISSKVRKQDRQFHTLLEATKSKEDRKADAEETLLGVKKVFGLHPSAKQNYNYMKEIALEIDPEKRKELIESVIWPHTFG